MEKKTVASSSRTFEFTVISAEDLRIKDRPIKKNAFVTIKVDRKNYSSTSIDKDGGGYPCWNQKMCLELHYGVRFIGVEVQCRTGRRSNKVSFVGSAKVPVSDIDGGYVPSHYMHFLSYRLRQRDGERNGIINLSVRVLMPERICRTLMETFTNSSCDQNGNCENGSSRCCDLNGRILNKLPDHEIVLGVPVSLAYVHRPAR